MNLNLIVRITNEDRINIKAAAQAKGWDVSTLVRQLLIENKIITAM